MATHAGLAIELGITRKKSLSPQMEAILIWCQCRTREDDSVTISVFTQSWSDGLAFCALIHNFFPNAFDFRSLKTGGPADRKKNFELAFTTGEKFAGVPDFLTAEDMSGMVGKGEWIPRWFSPTSRKFTECATNCNRQPLSQLIQDSEPRMIFISKDILDKTIQMTAAKCS